MSRVVLNQVRTKSRVLFLCLCMSRLTGSSKSECSHGWWFYFVALCIEVGFIKSGCSLPLLVLKHETGCMKFLFSLSTLCNTISSFTRHTFFYKHIKGINRHSKLSTLLRHSPPLTSGLVIDQPYRQ